jgi:hypothetical protein
MRFPSSNVFPKLFSIAPHFIPYPLPKFMPFKTYIPRQKGQVTMYSLFQNIHSVSVGFGNGPIKHAYHKDNKTENKNQFECNPTTNSYK